MRQALKLTSAFAIALLVLSGFALVADAVSAGNTHPSAPAQGVGGTVTGVIKDVNNRSADGAQVVLSQGSQLIASQKTGSNGSFSFLVPAGTYDLTINYTGYQIYTKTVNLVEGQTLDLGYVRLTALPSYYWILMDIIMVVGAVSIFLLVGKRVRKL